jgi:hypothetical protein
VPYFAARTPPLVENKFRRPIPAAVVRKRSLTSERKHRIQNLNLNKETLADMAEGQAEQAKGGRSLPLCEEVPALTPTGRLLAGGVRSGVDM